MILLPFFTIFTVIWCQKSTQGVHESIEEIRWRAVTENPLTTQLMTLTQFLQQCSHTPHTVNDIVFNGTFAVAEDYVECSKIINQLPNVRRFAMVNAQPMLFRVQPNVLWQVHDLALRSCRLSQLPHLMFGMNQLYSLDVSCNYLTDLVELEVLNLHNLKKLFLSRNKFSVVPRAIHKMKRVAKIDMSSNQISMLNGEEFRELVFLKELDLSLNPGIQVIPEELVNLPHLTHLNITGLNGLKKPVYSLAKKGLEHIRKYFYDLHKTGWFESTATSAVVRNG